MRKFILSMLLLLTLACASVPVFAAPIGPGPAEPGGGVEPTPPGEGGGGGGAEPGPDPGPPVEPAPPTELSFSPRVTAMHSVNGILANNGEAVYFIPRAEDFPVDLTTTLADFTTNDGVRHQFSVVYDGYFNNEVEYSIAVPDSGDGTEVARVQTSKKIYSQYDNSRALNLIGYDLLLADEKAYLDVGGGYVTAKYYPTLVGTAPLTAKTVIMDLYKAVGQYEWDVKLTYGIDESLAVNTSPIMQYLAVDINDLIEGGIDTSEGATYVWATRTNPDIYWLRQQRDAIFDGGAHKYTSKVYVGNDVSVTFSKSESSYVSMAEFCQLAHAIMELYGEPVLTEREREFALQKYSTAIPSSGMTKEAIEDIVYLSAKGILDPTGVDFDKSVTFADIEPLLLRIADVESRLDTTIALNTANLMTRAGFVHTDIIAPNTTFDSFEEVNNPYDADYYDYFVEAVDGKTNFYLTKLSGIDLRDQDGFNEDDGDDGWVGGLPAPPIIEDEKTYAFACDKLTVDGASGAPTATGGGYFNFLGIKEIYNKHYYHFRIAASLESVTVRYAADPEREELLDITEYTLPSDSSRGNGGVYNYSGETVEHLTFDEAGFSDYYLDEKRCTTDLDPVFEATESYLSDEWHWYVVRWGEKTWSDIKANKGETCPIFTNPNTSYPAEKVLVWKDIQSALTAAEAAIPWPSSGITFYVSRSPVTKTVNLVIQSKLNTTEIAKALSEANNTGRSDDGYYRHDDGTLMVSLGYLRRANLVSLVSYLDDGAGLVLTTPNGNVVLRNDIGMVIVGDTIVLCNSSEPILYKDGSTYYINYKALVGWTDSFSVVTTGNAVIPANSVTGSLGAKSTSTVKSVSSFFPASTVSVGWKTVTKGISTSAGIALTGSNPLSNYLVVYDEVTQKDKVFVWHRKGVLLPSGDAASEPSDARGDFESLTGISLSGISDEYILVKYDLSRNTPTHNFKYHSYLWCDGWNSGENSLGYIYTPKTYDTVKAALKDYHNYKTSCILPVAKIKGKYINLNLNICTDPVTKEYLPVGTLPMKLVSKKDEDLNKMGVLKTVGSSTQVKESTSTYESLDTTELLAAPVGIFAQLRGIGEESVSSLKTSGVYFGSSKCKIVNGVPTINNFKVEFDESSPALKAFQGKSPSSDLYVLQVEGTSLGSILEELARQGELIVSDPERMIDWGAYKFNRLVENMDGWSTVALIFILNIFPRVAILLFFAIMLLSLIKDVKPWRMFCERVFDIYSFLSFGKLNVNTVDTKRIVLISLICIAIFSVIMDGVLFEFIIWIMEWFIVLYQR